MSELNSSVQIFNLSEIDQAATTKEKILYSAMDLFSKRGYHGISIREITRTVGIKESSLYNHFRSKEEILECILINFRREFALILPQVKRLDDILKYSSIESFLQEGINLFIKHVDHPVYEKVWRIIYTEHIRYPLAKEIFLTDFIRNTLTFLEVVFKKAIDMKKIKNADPKILAAEYQYPVFAMLAEYNILKFTNEDTEQIQEKMVQHIKYFVSNITENQLL